LISTPATATATATPPVSTSAPSFASMGTAAAAKMTPQSFSGQGAFGRLGGQQSSSVAKSQKGPLSADNWQMNRTTSLVVRNVPGANLFMTAAGMTG
jgi:hypothetical protein